MISHAIKPLSFERAHVTQPAPKVGEMRIFWWGVEGLKVDIRQEDVLGVSGVMVDDFVVLLLRGRSIKRCCI